jgi:hypothetical protein
MKRSDFSRYIQISICPRYPLTLEDIGWLSEGKGIRLRGGEGRNHLGSKRSGRSIGRHFVSLIGRRRSIQIEVEVKGGSNRSSITNQGNHTKNGGTGDGDGDGNGCYQTEGNGCEDSGTRVDFWAEDSQRHWARAGVQE